MTTELSGSTGSRATAEVHDRVREDLAVADRRRAQVFFTNLLALLVKVNYGEGVHSPSFIYDVPEDLQTERIERDSKLFSLARKTASAEYLAQFGLSEDMYEDAQIPQALNQIHENKETFTDDTIIESTKKQDKKQEKRLFGFLDNFFKKREKEYDKKTNEIIAHYTGEIEKATSFEEALEQVMSTASDSDVTAVASAVEEIRYISGNVGGSNA